MPDPELMSAADVVPDNEVVASALDSFLTGREEGASVKTVTPATPTAEEKAATAEEETKSRTIIDWIKTFTKGKEAKISPETAKLEGRVEELSRLLATKETPKPSGEEEDEFKTLDLDSPEVKTVLKRFTEEGEEGEKLVKLVEPLLALLSTQSKQMEANFKGRLAKAEAKSNEEVATNKQSAALGANLQASLNMLAALPNPSMRELVQEYNNSTPGDDRKSTIIGKALSENPWLLYSPYGLHTHIVGITAMTEMAVKAAGGEIKETSAVRGAPGSRGQGQEVSSELEKDPTYRLYADMEPPTRVGKAVRELLS